MQSFFCDIAFGCSFPTLAFLIAGDCITTSALKTLCPVSTLITLAQDVDEPWPIEVYAHDGKAYNVTMEVRAQYWVFVLHLLYSSCGKSAGIGTMLRFFFIVFQHSPVTWYFTRVTPCCTDDHSP